MKIQIALSIVTLVLAGCESQNVKYVGGAEAKAIKQAEVAAATHLSVGQSAEITNGIHVTEVKVRGCWIIVVVRDSVGSTGESVAVMPLNEINRAPAGIRSGYSPQQQVCD